MYVIYDFSSQRFVCKRRNVSYELFTDYLHKARFYKSKSSAELFAREIIKARPYCSFDFRIISIPSSSF